MKELSKTKFAIYSSLGSAKMRKKHGLFTVEGEKAVEDSLPSFCAEALICEDGYQPAFHFDTDRTFWVTREQMKHLSSLSTPSPVMAVFRLPEEDLYHASSSDLKLPEGLYLALDGVQDPGNMGTIIRTCHWFGVKRIFASKDCADAFNPKAVQSAMGSLGKVRVTSCDLIPLFDANPEKPVYGTLLEGEDIFRTEISHNAFIVMGNEGKGLSEAVKRRITSPLFIPPKNSNDHSESLNVAIATAIVLALAVR